LKIDCSVNAQAKQKVFKIEGEVDVHQAKNLKSAIMDSVEKGNWEYIIDMSEVCYLDSSGLGMLVFIKKEITRNEGKLIIQKVQDSVLGVFKLTKLDEFFGLA